MVDGDWLVQIISTGTTYISSKPIEDDYNVPPIGKGSADLFREIINIKLFIILVLSLLEISNSLQIQPVR